MGKVFESEQCEHCNEDTWVKPWNGKPDYCGVCGHNLSKQRAKDYSSIGGVADD